MNLSANGALNSNTVGTKQLEYIPESFEEEESHHVDNHNTTTGHDMFFSCCDWEALRNAEKQHNEDSQNCGENFSDSDDEILGKISHGHQSPKESKRKLKASRKFPQINLADQNQHHVNFDEFDVDLVMKRVPCPNDSERIVSTKKYFSKSRRNHTHAKRSSQNS